MIYIPYSDYYEACKALDDARLQTQCEWILAGLNFLTTESPELPPWDKSTRCDLATLGLYTCAELRSRGYFVIYERRIKAAWFRLRQAGKLHKRPILSEALQQSFRELLVWEAPELYEDKFGLVYSPFKPEIQW